MGTKNSKKGQNKNLLPPKNNALRECTKEFEQRNTPYYELQGNRKGRITGSMRRLSSVIDELELKDLSQGGSFTWRGGMNNQRMARLDRFLVTNDWDDLFDGVTQNILSNPISDHFPVLLEGGGLSSSGPLPF